MQSGLVQARATLQELEVVRDEYRASGLYGQAQAVQRQIEERKSEHEALLSQALQQKHQEALVEQEHISAAEYQASVAKWEQQLGALQTQHTSEQDALKQQHLRDQHDLRHRFEDEEAKHHPGSKLLDLRRQEEHLRRQCRFVEADKIKCKADDLEHQEQVASTHALQARRETAMQRLQAAQDKQLRALHFKQQAAWHEAVRSQNQELERLWKRAQAARLALQRKQGKERLDLDLASKGWFNTHRPPSPSRSSTLTSPTQAAGPGPAVRQDSNPRPATAPAHLGHKSTNPGTAASQTPLYSAHKAWNSPAGSLAALSTRVATGSLAGSTTSTPSTPVSPLALAPKPRGLAVYSARSSRRT